MFLATPARAATVIAAGLLVLAAGAQARPNTAGEARSNSATAQAWSNAASQARGNPLAASAHARGTAAPTARQIRTAVRQAEQSSSLWATVNICNTPRFPGVIGIRAQMPALTFGADMTMRFEVQYWSFSAHQFEAVPDSTASVSLGVQKTGLHQSGVQYTFGLHAGYLRGIVRFQWKLGRRLIGQIAQTTSHGHPDADYGDPAHFSAWKCDLS